MLNWCQEVSHNPSYHLFAASELAITSRQAHSIIIPVSKGTEGMGWYNHMVNHRSSMESSERVSLAFVIQAEKQSKIEELYALCTELASLAQAADVMDEPSQCLLSPFVSTTYGELDQASAQKVIECMVENGLRADSLFLDIGCCYCKVLVHVAYATGINVYGVEALRERTERGKRCVQRWKATHPELARQTGGIEIFAGDIIHNLHLLFPAYSRPGPGFIVHAKRQERPQARLGTPCGLQTADGVHLHDVGRCQRRDGAGQPAASQQMDEENFIALRVQSQPAVLHTGSSGRGGVQILCARDSALRAGRDFQRGETVLEVHGTKSSTYAKDDRWPWMIRPQRMDGCTWRIWHALSTGTTMQARVNVRRCPRARME